MCPNGLITAFYVAWGGCFLKVARGATLDAKRTIACVYVEAENGTFSLKARLPYLCTEAYGAGRRMLLVDGHAKEYPHSAVGFRSFFGKIFLAEGTAEYLLTVFADGYFYAVVVEVCSHLVADDR